MGQDTSSAGQDSAGEWTIRVRERGRNQVAAGCSAPA